MTQAPTPGPLSGGDEMLYARAIVFATRDKPSTSYLQRRLQIGFNLAASLIERMENEGLISKANSAGKRTILVPFSAPTAPVEASGSELHPATADLVDRFAAELKSKLAKAESKYGYRDEWLKPDWQDELTKSLAEHIQKGDPRDVAAYCAFAWHHEWSVTPNINWKAEWEAVCSARIADRDRSQEIINERDAWIAELLQQAKVTTPARAEAQDEGAAGKPVAWLVQGEGKRDRLVNARQYNPTKLDYWISAEAMAEHTITPLYAHPSPTPAADADRVRIAVEAFNAKINAPLTGPTHGAWDRGRIAGLKEALAALKSTAAKEGGE